MPHTEQGLAILNVKLALFLDFSRHFMWSSLCIVLQILVGFVARNHLFCTNELGSKWRHIPVRTSISPNLKLFDCLSFLLFYMKLLYWLILKNLLVTLFRGNFDHENAYRNPPYLWIIKISNRPWSSRSQTTIQYSTIAILLNPLPFHCTLPLSCLGHVNLRRLFLQPMRGGHWRKSTNDREGSRYRNYDAASGPILKISQGFHGSKQKKSLNLIFSSTRHPKNYKPAAHEHKELNQFDQFIGL